jgi:DNA-binding NarL/FixJ family response regulator
MIETAFQKHQPIPIALVSRPGIMQQSLRSALAACQGIAVVASSGDGLNALRQVAKLGPGLLVIDSNLLDEEVEALIAAVKAEQPNIGCLVIVRSSQQQARMLASGADAVVMRDVSPQQLQTELARLARRREILRPEQRLCDEKL